MPIKGKNILSKGDGISTYASCVYMFICQLNGITTLYSKPLCACIIKNVSDNIK
jgi:hypothetical protein